MKALWILAGTAVSVVFTFLLIFVIAAAEYYTGLPEGAAGICVYAAAAISVFMGALFAVNKASGKALVHAFGVSFLYTASLLAASAVINGRINTDIHCISIIAGVFLAGFLGAVCGRK